MIMPCYLQQKLMDALMLSLMAWLHFHTGYDTEVELPNVAITEVGNLCQNFGIQAINCEAMQLEGFYNERQTIYLHDQLQQENPADQARLLQELMHYIQWHNAEQVDTCWGLLEAEAYHLQEQWGGE